MNDMTKLKHYLDRCVGGDNPEESKFAVVRRTYSNEKNRHQVEILYSYRNSSHLPVTLPKHPPVSRKRKLYDEIMKAKKIRISKGGNRKP